MNKALKKLIKEINLDVRHTFTLREANILGKRTPRRAGCHFTGSPVIWINKKKIPDENSTYFNTVLLHEIGHALSGLYYFKGKNLSFVEDVEEALAHHSALLLAQVLNIPIDANYANKMVQFNKKVLGSIVLP